MESKERIIKSAVMICLVALLATSAFFLIKGWSSGSFRSMDSLRDYISSFGIWAPMVLMLIQMFLTILPISTCFTGCVVGGALLGAAGGFWTNYIGISVGSIIAFGLAKHYGVRLVDKMLSMDKHKAYIEKINQSKSYPKFLFLAILLPMAPDNFLCYFSGLVNMPTKRFITIIITAKPWCILFYSIFFAYFI